ncbi:MAG TPA: aldo/keto reductase [candidate division Zixibacteria bacterium]|nr:aldo/keto reductase [candidate division Zixibacteria bacterium]
MIEKKPFGNTGHNSTRVIFGAAALGRVTQDEADQALQQLLDYGINHIDTAPSYGDAEVRLGPWMPAHRSDFFLATKTLERTREGAWKELNQSFERMQVDSVDHWQMHYLVDPQEWEIAFGPGGAIEAMVEAREQGLVRHLGVTGHDVAIAEMHLRSLDRFAFDSVLLPYNYMMMHNPKYAADFEALIQLCSERSVAVQTIKSLVKAPWRDEQKSAATWYEPLTDQEDIDRAVSWVLSRPGLFLISASDVKLLPKVLLAASRATASPTEAEMAEASERLSMKPLFL